MTYISTASASLALRQSVLQLQTAYAKAQTEVSTGQVADLGLSLGFSTGRTVSLTQDKARLQAITDSNTLVATRLTTTQNALASLSTTAQSLSDTLVSSGSDKTSGAAFVAQAKAGLQSLTATLDTTVDGQSIFAGINTDAKPVADYVENPPSASKQAVDATFASTFGFSQTDPAAANISAADMQSFLDTQFSSLFQAASWSSTWSQASDQTQTSRISPTQSAETSVTANRSGFQNLAQAYTMIAEFGGGNLGTAATAAVRSTAQRLIGAATTDLTAAQAGVGVTQAAITQANDSMATQMDVMSTSLGALENIDPYEASTRVTNLQTQLQASYQLTAQLHSLSLLNYLPSG